MTTHDSRQKGMSWISPYLTVRDADSAIEFYKNAFGFGVKDAVKGDDGKVTHAELTYKDQIVMLGAEGAYNGNTQAPITSGTASPVSLYVYCHNVDELFKQAVASGATAISKPEDAFWGDRLCKMTDPDGHSWCFATALKACHT